MGADFFYVAILLFGVSHNVVQRYRVVVGNGSNLCQDPFLRCIGIFHHNLDVCKCLFFGREEKHAEWVVFCGGLGLECDGPFLL